MTRAFLALLRRDLILSVRIGGGFELVLIFFLMIVALVPFAVGPDPNLLSRIAPAILWIAALLATLLGLDRLFQADAEDGSLDMLRMARLPLELAALAKMAAHWLASGLLLALAAPALGLLLSLEPAAMLPLSLTLLVGTPALTAIGAIGAALTARMRRGGLLSSILVLPLMLPTLIFGVSATQAALGGGVPFRTPLLMLGAISLIAIVLGAWASAAALRMDD
ncbi:MAG: heme exporter protein CcmB [Rhizobiales bacterium 65-9]|nr:heme exporter protein CcmB [Hyphomicrobiales bacterium]OJY36519.1 MAG: heme exporter protein CcmB [Rhizobiales bacterium 65-9]